MPISRRALGNAIGARLLTVTHATGYYGQIGRALPGALTPPPANPLPKSDLDERVQPYFILFPGLGSPVDDQVDLGDSNVDLDWPFGITAAGGDAEDVVALVDRIHDALHRWAPTVAGIQCGPIRVPAGYRVDRLLADRNTTPERLFLPLLYQLTAHT
jgi:hypothetical protein